MHGFIDLLRQASDKMDPALPYQTVLFIFANSLLLGFILTYTTYFTITAEQDKTKDLTHKQAILGASNILFLCIGLSGVMILVANNFTRALAIGATISLIRFRVKIGNKNLGANLLFGIIVGIACGLQEVAIAWVVTIVYTFLQIILWGILKYKYKNSA